MLTVVRNMKGLSSGSMQIHFIPVRLRATLRQPSTLCRGVNTEVGFMLMPHTSTRTVIIFVTLVLVAATMESAAFQQVPTYLRIE